MRTVASSRWVFVLLAALSSTPFHAEQIPVRHPQGSMHAFLVLKTISGNCIAVGDVMQSVHGVRVTSRVVFHFRDGSLDEETTVFRQSHVFRLMSDHHVQRGPSFPKPSDILIDAVTGQITSRAEDGKVTQEHLDLPSDVANGLLPVLALNLLSSTPETKFSFVAPTEKPRIVNLSIKPAGKVSFRVGGYPRAAMDYVVHVELGGLTGVVAPIIGKQPADLHMWVLEGSEPMFLREKGQFYEGGPIWQVEQISPTFSSGDKSEGQHLWP